MKTGQTTSYRTGDDGDLEEGRATDFFTLASNNPFGNTNRFTDELGGSTYTNDIVIDWSTYDGSTVLGYRRTQNGLTLSWNNAIDGALAVSIGAFTTGWRLPNIYELFSLYNYEVATTRLNYAPFNFSVAFELWTSTTNPSVTSNAMTMISQESSTRAKISAAAVQYIPVRTFTVTGTTLT
jgi:hypothetical protein